MNWIRRPPVDSRLVGRWINVDPDGEPRQIEFRSNGLSTWILNFETPPMTRTRRWSVQGEELEWIDTRLFRLRLDMKSILGDVDLVMDQLIDHLSGRDLTSRTQIVEVSNTILKLKRHTIAKNENPKVKTFVRADAIPTTPPQL